METLSLIILVLVITIIAIGLLVWVYIHHRKQLRKAVAVITAGSLLGGSSLFLIPTDIIESPATITGNHLFYTASSLKAYFEVNTTIHFGQIILNSGYTKFNDTRFTISSPYRVNVTLMNIVNNVSTANSGEKVIDFYANTSSGLVTFTIGGMKGNVYYIVKKDGVIVNTTMSNATGYIIFKNSAWSNHHFEIYEGLVYSQTIRNTNVDYFMWLGSNTSAWNVSQQITGFDEAGEYIATWNGTIWDATNGLWKLYYGDESGTNWSIHTFDVVKVVLTDVGSQTITVNANLYVDYDTSKSKVLTNTTSNYGYNYSGYNMPTTTTSALNTSIGLTLGDFVGVWNRTSFDWDIFISGFEFMNYRVDRFGVIITKVSGTKTWNT